MENLTAKLIPIDKGSETIILLHGLFRTSRSMNKAGELLAAYGYNIINVDYPSRSADIGALAQQYIGQALKQCATEGVKKIHFLTHSMGGILLRDYLANQAIDKLGRVVMLAPPNQGSEVVDKLGSWRLFYYLNGPAGLQLGTGSNSVPNRLGPVNFQLGVIAGSKTANPFLSRLIPDVNDGKVSVSRAQVAGMQDFIVMPYSHPFIMRRVAVIEQALHFIQQGYFAR
ncbi:esterase/lipase family protein [Methylobacter svalbardensis]|uniref:esterase/lipase family protein n=1 Tax=Methylobacter svalbardensis TaxID=3080016 RepID=UPI0030ECE54D